MAFSAVDVIYGRTCVWECTLTKIWSHFSATPQCRASPAAHGG